MTGILDYVNWRGDLTFEQSPFNEIDALVLCQMSYINFSGFVNNSFDYKVTYRELYQRYQDDSNFQKQADLGLIINSKTLDLFKLVGQSDRFGSIKPCGYVQDYSQAKQEQFSAITNVLSDGTVFVAYRGTDDSIVGLKEDFNLALMDEIPAQRDSLAYLKNAIAALRSSFKFRVGGHSKGGNCAIYACAYLDPEEKTALYKIYNNDGPGFTQERLNSENFKSIRSLIESYYPKFSIVGMLFESDSEYQVIDNDAVLIFQHDLFSWHILGKHFVTVPTFKSGSEFFGETFNDWYSSLDLDKKKKFIDTMFMVLEASGAKTYQEFVEHFAKNSIASLASLKNVDADTAKAVMTCFGALIKSAGKTIIANGREEEKLIEDSSKKKGRFSSLMSQLMQP